VFISPRATVQPDMIAAEVVPALLLACPSAERSWLEHRAWWDDEEPGRFLDVAVFSRHIVHSYRESNTVEFASFFAVVEKMIAEGEPEVVGLATVGILECIQANASHQPFGGAPFVPWLLPQSREAWADLEAQWEGISTLADVVRAETKRP
jgi:hypothetical protein